MTALQPTSPNALPKYAAGCAGYVISKFLSKYIVNRYLNQNLTLYQNEDTAIGIWLHQGDILTKERIQYIDSTENFGTSCQSLSPCWMEIENIINNYGVVDGYNLQVLNNDVEFNSWNHRLVYSQKMTPTDLEKCFRYVQRFGQEGDL